MSTKQELSVGEIDARGRLVVDTSRDKPPIGKVSVSALCLHFDNGTPLFVGVQNISADKSGTVTLPGGRVKGRGEGTPVGNVEDPIETAVCETEEEAGARHTDGSPLTTGDFYPILRGIVHHEPLRDENDDPVINSLNQRQVRGPIPHLVFCHLGDLELRETTDSDTKEPRWCSMDEMVEKSRRASVLHARLRNRGLSEGERETLKNELSEAEAAGAWSLKHIVLLSQSLCYMSKGLSAYRANEIENAEDCLLYEKMWDMYALSGPHASAKNMFALEDLMSFQVGNITLDPEEILFSVIQDQGFSEKFLRKFEVVPQTLSDYFPSKTDESEEEEKDEEGGAA